MSVSEQEAEELYPTKYYDDYPTVLESFNATSDDLQEAYIRGREAEPCEEQVDVVAELLFNDSWNCRKPPMSFKEFMNIKDDIVQSKVERFRKQARTILNAARKVVM